MDEVVEVRNRGGILRISCERREERYELHMMGPARWVFSGETEVDI
jgi:diaminopimelate epimerase